MKNCGKGIMTNHSWNCRMLYKPTDMECHMSVWYICWPLGYGLTRPPKMLMDVNRKSGRCVRVSEFWPNPVLRAVLRLTGQKNRSSIKKALLVAYVLIVKRYRRISCPPNSAHKKSPSLVCEGLLAPRVGLEPTT